jgi:hypothetical protein
MRFSVVKGDVLHEQCMCDDREVKVTKRTDHPDVGIAWVSRL